MPKIKISSVSPNQASSTNDRNWRFAIGPKKRNQRAAIAAKKAVEEATHKKAKAARAKKRAANAAGESASESSDGKKPAGWQGKFALDVAAERKKRKGNPSTPGTPKAPKANPNPNNARDDQLTWQSRGQLVQKLGSIKVLRTTWHTCAGVLASSTPPQPHPQK